MNRAANVFLLSTLMALGVVVWLQYRAPAATAKEKQNPFAYAHGGKAPQIAGVNFALHRQSLIVFLSTSCHYCRESAPFYNRMADYASRATSDLGFYPVFAEPESAVLASEEKLKLSAKPVTNANFSLLRIHSTPTALLVDRNGIVTQFWIGTSPSVENDIQAKVAGE